MGRNNETTLLISHRNSPKHVLKFTLELVPPHVRPYFELIRLEKVWFPKAIIIRRVAHFLQPTGTVLMFWPFAWGLTMAAFTTSLSLEHYGGHLIKCFIGAFLLRSSACTVNDILDREMDAGVERTKNRPLASGRISVFAATTYLFAQYILGIYFFYLTVHDLALWVSLFQLLPLFAIYPLLKRFTHWPQAWLGLAMNFGFATAWVSLTGRLDVKVLVVALTGCWCWTMFYDTIYACQDIKDDIKIGVRSTAVLFRSWIKPLLVMCAVGFITMLGLVGFINKQGPPYFVLSVGGATAHLVWQLWVVDLDVPASCWENFQSNGQLGWIVWGGLMVDYFLSIGFFQYV